MSDERKYYDSDGKEVSLNALCRIEPEWAASRIRYMDKQHAQLRDAAKRVADSFIMDHGDCNCVNCRVIKTLSIAIAESEGT